MQDVSENETIQFVMEYLVQLNKNYELPIFTKFVVVVVVGYYRNRFE